MSVFQNEGYPSEPLGKAVERCKRDYEQEIERYQKRNKRTSDFIIALEGYIDINGRGSKQFTLTELYGSLQLEQREFQRTIEMIQEEWEKDPNASK